METIITWLGSAMIAGAVTYIAFVSLFLGMVVSIALITSVLMANDQ